MSLSLACTLAQNAELTQKLSQLIELGNLLKIPDEVLSAVAGSVAFSPERVEEFLVRRKEDRKKEEKKYDDSAEKVQAIYPIIYTPETDTSRSRGGIISPCLGGLERTLALPNTVITPDVTFIGKKNDKPSIVYSDHLKAGIGLFPLQLNVNASIYPETARLIAHLTSFDNWKRGCLRDAYLIMGNHQREYFEALDKTRMMIMTQEDLGKELGVSASTISRILSNRFVEARGLEGEPQFLNSKDLLVTKDDLRKNAVLPKLNRLMVTEFERKETYSDEELAKLSGGIARRTVVKYRQQSHIPDCHERSISYRSGREGPFTFP